MPGSEGAKRRRRNKKRNTPDVTLKLLVVGDAGIGKTALVNRYAGGDFDAKYNPTVGIDLKITKVQMDQTQLRVQIWDTSGDDKYLSITKGYYAQADGIVLCYRRDKQSSFDNLPMWIAQIERGIRPGQEVDKIMVALADDVGNAVVANKSGEQVAAANGMKFFTSSAKEGNTAAVAINALVSQIKERKFPGQHMNASSVLQDINKADSAPEDIVPQKPVSSVIAPRPEVEMTETLQLVVDFMRTKKLDRSCDLLLEEWRLRQTSGSSSLENATKLEGIVTSGSAAAPVASEGTETDHPTRTLGVPTKDLAPGEIGTGDEPRGGAPTTSVEDGPPSSQATDPAKIMSEVQKEAQNEKIPHPYGNYSVFNMKVIYNPNKTGFEESAEYPMKTNQVIAGRYQILDYIGSAAFSHAVQCLDLTSGDLCCAKIIKNNKDFLDQGLDEIKLLKLINRSGDVHSNNVVEIYDYFYHKEHLFIVCELLRDNLYEVQRYLRDAGEAPYFTMPRLQKIARQCLEGLMYVHSLGLIHCDLKPENILIKSFSRCEVKVIDFGSTCFTTDHLTSYVQSRSYRAPEVILGCPYGQKIDIWSLGCILSELLTGDVLFENMSIQSLLARVQAFVGPFPKDMLQGALHTDKYFTSDFSTLFEKEEETGQVKYHQLPKSNLAEQMKCEDTEFVAFVEWALTIDQDKRPTAAECLTHPWFDKYYEWPAADTPAQGGEATAEAQPEQSG
jgi:small GTP-binding protein